MVTPPSYSSHIQLPHCSVTHPPLVSKATAALTVAVAKAFVGQLLSGPVSTSGYFLTDDPVNGFAGDGDIQYVSKACPGVYPGLTTSNPLLRKYGRWQYNLKGVGNVKYLLPGVLQNSTLTCEIK